MRYALKYKLAITKCVERKYEGWGFNILLGPIRTSLKPVYTKKKQKSLTFLSRLMSKCVAVKLIHKPRFLTPVLH